MKTILVPTDFSPASMNAISYAADMASAIAANILLLHVYQIPYTYGEVSIVINHEEMMQDAAEKLNNIKEDVGKRIDAAIGIETEVRPGTFFHDLKEVCDRIKPYAVVLGSQGASALQRVLFGNNSVYALKHLMWPVIAVPPDVKFSRINKIGLACDFDKVTETIPLDEVRRLVNDFNATLYVLNTGKTNEFNPDLVFESHLLHTLLKDLKPNYHFITANDKNQGIIDFAEKNNFDLLIVFPKPHDLLNKILQTSHTKQLVLHCHVPVIALHHSPA